MPRDPRILWPAENLATLFLFNAIQFDSDILMQDQHLLNDIKYWKEDKPHYPSVTLHILFFTKINVLMYVITMYRDKLSSKSNG